MRLLIQRVARASVIVGEEVVGSISEGLLCLVGIAATDTAEDAKWAQTKIANTRLWDSAAGKPWMEGVKQRGGSVLLVSQFTLHGFLKGNRPDFHLSMGSADAEKLFNDVVERVRRELGDPDGSKGTVQTGRFGAHMMVESVNDGPVSIWLDSDLRGQPKGKARPAGDAPAQAGAEAPAGSGKKAAKRAAKRAARAAAASAQQPRGTGEAESRLAFLRAYVK